MKEQFQTILEAVKQGRSAALHVDIEGKEYTRNFLPRERLILLGGGHIALPLCTIASMLGFSVVVVDDRPMFANRPRFPEADEVICEVFPKALQQLNIRAGDYVCVITRGHRYDADCLREILKGTMPYYLGMIGSRRRTVALLELLEEEGYEREKLDQICTPIGIPIGALTTKEIAVSIVAELIQYRRENTDRRAKSMILTNEEIDMQALEFAVNNEIPKALLLVYETSGSTPVKSGSFMLVDQMFRQAGTIGGGCSESAVLRDAFHLIGTGESQSVTIDMSNDVAAEEGMVCGGQMKVLLADLG